MKDIIERAHERLAEAERRAIGTTREYTVKSFYNGFCYALALLIVERKKAKREATE